MALKIVLSEKGEPVKLERSSFIITGGTRGIGRGLAEALLSRGACVAISGRNQNRLKSALKSMDKLGGEVFGLAGDVGNDGDARKLAQAARSHFGRVDFLINNAAIIAVRATVVNTPSRIWEEVLRVNVIGTVNMIRHVLPEMQERRAGFIVNLTSGWGRFGEAEVASYCASKFAVEGLTQSVAAEAGDGVAVVALSPGIIATDMLATAFGEDVSHYPSPGDIAPRWMRFLEKMKPSWNGKSLDLDDH